MTGQMKIIVGPSSLHLGQDVCEALEVAPTAYDHQLFPDGEMQVELRESVRGCHLYLLQSTSPPVERHMMELLLLADACRRAGAARMTAVIPYFGYARQERRTGRRSVGARVAADVIATGRFDRLMLIDAHTPAIEGFFSSPIDHLTAVPMLAQAAAPSVRDNSVVVAPDLGGVKRAREYARLLELPMAFVHKTRVSGEAVEAHAVIGDVRGRQPIIVDDMLSTGGTVEAAAGALRAAGALEPITVVVTHALLVGRAREILAALPIDRLIAANTVPLDPGTAPHLSIVSAAPLVATALRRDHRDESLADLRVPA